MSVIVDPDLPIVDAHHHLAYHRTPYEIEDLLADVNAGHNIVATIFAECKAGYRTHGPEELRPVGESELILKLARSAPPEWRDRLCAGIVAFADLRLGERVNPVLDAHHEASDGRLCGIRQLMVYDPDPFFSAPYLAAPDLMENSAFRQGIRELGRRGLVFDAIAFHPQHGKLIELAKSIPETKFVINHLGSFTATGPYASRLAEERERWLSGLEALAALPNTFMKIGGLGMRRYGSQIPPGEMGAPEQVAREWRGFVLPAIDIFGPARCMFETNFPVDRATCGYADIWNVFKMITADFSGEDRRRMFCDTALDTYRINLAAPGAAIAPMANEA